MESHSVPPRKGCLRGDLARLLASSLNCHLLGVEMTAGLYACNGFRFLGIPGSASDVSLESAAQKFRNLYKFDPTLAMKSCIPLGYDAHLSLTEDDVRECLTRLQDPRYRLVYAVFWPHVPEECFAPIRSHHALVAPAVIQHLTEVARQATGLAGLLAIHALAIAYHNQAIAHEVAFGSGEAEWTEQLWVKALTYWAKVVAADEFWAYLRQRVLAWDDPRVTAADVAQMRERLPGVLLGFHTLLALAYDRLDEVTACDKHLTLIHPSDFPVTACTEVLNTTMHLLTERRIKPLIQQAETTLLHAAAKVSRQHFSRICTALLSEAFAVCHALTHDFHLPASLVARMQFDGLCDCLLKVIIHKLDYDTDDRLRSVLSGSLVMKKLLALPLSATMRATLERTLRDDTTLLYKDFLASPQEVDPTVCWFLDGEDADPDASLELLVYKITRREIHVQYQTGTASISVGYNAQRILVPRSLKARASHQGHSSVPPEALAAHEQTLQHIAQEDTAQIAQQQAQRDAAIANERTTCLHSQQAYRQHYAAEVAAAQELIAAEQARYERAIQQEETRYAGALQQHTEARDASLAAPQALLARLHRLHGWYRLEFPALLCIGVVLTILRSALSPAVSLTPISLEHAAIGVLSGLGALLTGGGGRAVWRRQARRQMAQIHQRYSVEAQQLHQEHLSQQEALARHAHTATEPARQILARVEEYCRQIAQQSAIQIAHIEHAYSAGMAESARHRQRQVAALQEQLRQQYEARPETTATDFPIYCHAKAAGYQDGGEPSASEREMTNAERNEARRRFEASPLSRSA